MKTKDIKFYPLPSGIFMVSYYDSFRQKRIQKEFKEEAKAKMYLNTLKADNAKFLPQPNLKNTSLEELLKTYFKQTPGTYFERSPFLVKVFIDYFGMHSPKNLNEMAMRTFLAQLKNENDYSEKSMLAIKYRFSGFMKFLIEKHLIETSPLENITFARTQYKKLPSILSEEKIAGLISMAQR
ncbi:MAG: hypothetical protein K2Q26_15840 [Bdellovibrionales bacterium]|nr:hypothetical protein [Bdellovibrionales bacterium]